MHNIIIVKLPVYLCHSNQSLLNSLLLLVSFGYLWRNTQWYESLAESSLFTFKVVSRYTCKRYQRWRSVFSSVYLIKNNFDYEAKILACLHPLLSWDMISIGGILVMSVSNSLNIPIIVGSVRVSFGLRASSSSWQLTMSFDTDCDGGC